MNKSAFLKLIQQVTNISDQQTEELEKVAAAFPYCQTAHLLLAKSAHDKGSMLSAQRLRRASSYATDRQLLKRIIYTSPAPAQEEETIALSHTLPDEVTVENNNYNNIDNQNSTPEENLPNVAAGPEIEAVITDAESIEETIPEPEQEEIAPAAQPTPEAPADSELALLLTINSLSSSFTDLLSQKPEEESITADESINPAQHDTPVPVNYDFEEDEETDVPEDGLILSDVLDCTFESIDLAIAAAPAASVTETDAGESIENPQVQEIDDEPASTDAQPQLAAVEDEQAEINYTLDEIDRLYAEDVLGYWMSSSRMGEVLQLKDEYTRQRPQSFHPELILEYSKTHELEKAVQPGTNTLNQQLDIIDQFLKLNPRLKTMANVKLKPEPQEDLSLKSSKIKKGIASESLANIFLKQGKVKKAVKIYEQLILKYPEKKSYFAEQIEKLQNQI